MLDNELLFELNNYNKYRRDLLYKGIDDEFIPYYDSILFSRYQKTSRIRKRFIYLLTRKKYVYFLTFTLNDKYINKCDRTQRDSIKDVLNSIEDSFYILNVDYGSRTERKHFHVIYGIDIDLDLDFLFSLLYHSFFNVKKINLKSSNDINKISKYINKLANHASKDSTYNKRVVYNFKGYDKFEKGNAFFLYTYDKYKLGL